MIGCHTDAIALKVKPHSSQAGYQSGGIQRIGVAPYSGGGRSQVWDAEFSTWWNRDLGVGGRVLVREGANGKITQRLMRSSGPDVKYTAFLIFNLH